MKSALPWILTNLYKLVVLLIVGYILFNIGHSIWKNFALEQSIKNTENEISELKKENEMLANQILYYQTEEFKELEARKRLGLKKPGENLLIVPDNTDSDNTNNQIGKKVAREKSTEELPNPLKWWNYVMGNE